MKYLRASFEIAVERQGEIIQASSQTETNQTETNRTETNQTEINRTEVNPTETNQTGTSAEADSYMDICRDLLSDVCANVGFDSFESTSSGLEAYIAAEAFDRSALDAALEDFPLEGVALRYVMSEVEDVLYYSQSAEVQLTDGLSIAIEAENAFGTGAHETTGMILSELTQIFATEQSDNQAISGSVSSQDTAPNQAAVQTQNTAPNQATVQTQNTAPNQVSAPTQAPTTNPQSPATVLDCGCGTGVLSVAAALLGAREVVGYDIDEWSVRNTLHNASLNGVTLTAYEGDSSLLASAESPAKNSPKSAKNSSKSATNSQSTPAKNSPLISGPFDLVMANINRNILLADLPRFLSVLAPGGTLLLSGFYEEDVPLLVDRVEALRPGGALTTRSRNRWALIRYDLRCD